MNTSTHTTAPATAAHGRAKVAAVDPVRAWLWVGASLALATGGLHVVAAAQHVQHGGLVVGFFLLVTLAQVGGGLWLALHAVTRMQPDRRLVLAALAATVGLVALFVVGYSTDLFAGYLSHPAAHAGHTAPAGPFAAGLPTIASNAQIRETPGILGMLTVTLELATVTALAALLPRTWRSRVINGLLGLGVLAWVLWFVGVLG